MDQMQQQIQQLQQQLDQVKAKGFDLFQQNEQNINYIQMLEGVLKNIAQKLGIDTETFTLESVLQALDSRAESLASDNPAAK